MLMEEVSNPTEYKIYCDLDGVLADFIKGVREKLVPDYTEERYEGNRKYRDEMWAAMREYAKNGGKFWYELDVMPDAHQLWNHIKDYNTEILTATGPTDLGASQQKVAWFPEKFGKGTKVNVVDSSNDKAIFAAPNHILIDDKDKSINPWIAQGGIGILHTSAANTISELKKLGL